MMRKLLILSVAAISLAACAGGNSPALDTTQVYVAAQAFDAAEVTATNYLHLPLCAAPVTTLCRTAALTRASASAQRRSQSGSGVPEASTRVPVAIELPDTSGQRGPVVSA